MKNRRFIRHFIFTQLLAITVAGSFAFADFSIAGSQKISALSLQNKGDELTALWWNVACFSGSDSQQNNQLLQNLEELAKPENRVDVLILGEDCPDKIPAELNAKLLATYSQRLFFPYEPNNPKTRHMGIGVFTSLDLTVGRSEALDWVSPFESEEERALARTFWGDAISQGILTRSYTSFEIMKQGKAYRVVPVHLVHPWHPFLKTWFPGQPQLAKAAIVKELLFGKKNPLIWQLEHLLLKVQRDNANLEDARLMLIGDFNFPTSIGLQTEAYKRIRQIGLSDGMGLSRATQKDVNLKIDHMFSNKSLETTRASVLPLNGSDHFPIFVRVR